MRPKPERIGPYRIRGKIGAGGMGVVHLCWDPRLKRNVAVKTLRPEMGADEEARRLFLREARAVAAISHPHVAQIYDIGEQDGMIFFAMEYLNGNSLQEVLKSERRLAPERAVALIHQAAQGLKAAADRGIVHRDVKPSNLVLLPDGTLKVTDFGLARVALAGSARSAPSVILGTPEYVAPERACGRDTDLRGDIYSLGITLYELLVGRPPFVGPDAKAVLNKHLREPVPAPRKLRPELPHALSLLLLRMLSKQPESRPQNYEVLMRQLERLPVVGCRGAPKPAVEAGPHPGPSTPWGVAALAAVLLLLAALGGWSQFARQDAEPFAPAPRNAGGPPGPPSQAGSGSSGGGTLPLSAGRRRAELTIVGNESEITTEGRLRVTGQVRNTGEGRAVHGRVRVSLVDETGLEIESAEVPLSPGVIGPGELGDFEALLPTPDRQTQIKVELTWLS